MSTFLITLSLILASVWAAEVVFVLIQYRQTRQQAGPGDPGS